MSRACVVSVVTLALTFAAGASFGQQAQRKPQIGYVYPAGGRQGTAVEVVLGGQMLVGANAVYVSGDGVRATVQGYKRPMTIGEANRIREKLEEARKKTDPSAAGPLRPRDMLNLRQLAQEAGVTDAQLSALNEFRLRRTDPKRQPNPQIEEEVTIKLEIDAGAEPGVRELRLPSAIGLTNPLRFYVGDLPEVRELEPNDRLPDTAVGNSLPVVVNGQIMPGDVDVFTFTARKGMNLAAIVRARDIMPYLADAVPGWFQAVVAIRDKDGKEIAYEDDFQFRPDPVLHVRIPEDGEYTLEVRDAIYRGREDFVYRITLGEVPFVTSLFPLGVRKGTRVTAQVHGWNLDATGVALEGSEVGTGVAVLEKGGVRSNEVAYCVDDLPETLEKEPNGLAGQANVVRSPTIINGRIDRPGDTDVYRFEGRKGAIVVAEVRARRLGSPLDSTLTLTDARGRQIGFNDDHNDRAAGLMTHQSDSRVEAALPADGTYYLRIGDAQSRGGLDYGYRLRISAPRPDFELRVSPSSLFARAGQTVPITVHVIRRDGFAGAVDLALKDPPNGFVLSGARLPEGLDTIRVTLSVAPGRALDRVELQMEGIARIGGSEVRRTALPVEEMMQAFAYTHLVPSQTWTAVVAGRAWARAPVPFSPDKPVRIPLGGTVKVDVARPGVPMAGQVTLQLDDPPPGITIEPSDGPLTTLALRADKALAKVGTRGNLIVSAYFTRPGAALRDRPQAQRLIPAGCLPAIPFEIVAP